MMKVTEVSEMRTASIIRDRSTILAFHDKTNFYILLHIEMSLPRVSIILVKILEALNGIDLKFFSFLDFARLLFPNDN
jgi:hypothetical protein